MDCLGNSLSTVSCMPVSGTQHFDLKINIVLRITNESVAGKGAMLAEGGTIEANNLVKQSTAT